MTTQQKENKEVLLKLIEATTQEEVTELIASHPFFKNCKWVPYGNQANNAGTIKAQAPDPVGALVEKITNGIDALLIRLCWDNKIDPASSSAPQSQYEAIKKFFGDKVANFDLSDKEVRELASKTVRIITRDCLPLLCSEQLGIICDTRFQKDIFPKLIYIRPIKLLFQK